MMQKVWQKTDAFWYLWMSSHAQEKEIIWVYFTMEICDAFVISIVLDVVIAVVVNVVVVDLVESRLVRLSHYILS